MVHSHKFRNSTSFISDQGISLKIDIYRNYIYIYIYILVCTSYKAQSAFLNVSPTYLRLCSQTWGVHLACLASLFLIHCHCGVSLKPKALVDYFSLVQARGIVHI